MNLAAIDIGTNSIHLVIVHVNANFTFDVIEQEKEMVKLGTGVFSTNQLSEQTYQAGLDTIRRYVRLADQRGVDEIITAATSAIREARNGGDFLDEVVRETGIAPQVISGKEEARLIFLAVRHAIALMGENTLVLDIGGGSTEAVVGNDKEILFRSSMKLGVRRLLDLFDDEGPVGKEDRNVLETYIRHVAQNVLEDARAFHFTRVIGTSGTIRTLGEAAHLAAGGKILRSVNAEVVALAAIKKLTQRLLKMNPDKRSSTQGIGNKRADAIHLGGVLLVQLLEMAGVQEITLCDASLREGLIIDYINRYSQKSIAFAEHGDLRHRSAAQLALKFNSDLEQKTHVAYLALQLYDQLESIHALGSFERDILEYAALLCGVGQYISFQSYHKHSRYIIFHSGLRGFTNEEIFLIGHVARYHRKSAPKKKHKKFVRLSKEQRYMVKVLAAILRIAVGFDTTKNQLVKKVACQITPDTITILPQGPDRFELEIWAASRNRKPLQKALGWEIMIHSEEKRKMERV